MKIFFIGLGSCIFGILLLLGVYLGILHLIGNIHTVIPQQVYRSEHLSAAHYKRVLQRYQIKTVLDLAPIDNLHQEEKITHDSHNTYIYFPMKAMGKTPLEKLRRLAILLIAAQRPLLIHCKSGSDRTGLASAMVLILNNAPIDKAMKQVAFVRYGIMNDHSTGRVTLKPYVLWLKQHHAASSGKLFLTWIYQ